jgi:periplasmic protein TonB
MKPSLARRQLLLTTSATGIATLLAACSSPPPAPVAVTPPPAPAPKPPPVAVQPRPEKISNALNAKDYRVDAATHLYGKNTERIYKGKMPPLLYAVGVLQVEVDRLGHVTSTHWMRAPRHAPEVMADIERTVRQASPFPAPVRLAGVTYTDTWLWHKSGRFQLDTLTEGQS